MKGIRSVHLFGAGETTRDVQRLPMQRRTVIRTECLLSSATGEAMFRSPLNTVCGSGAARRFSRSL